MVCSVSAGKEVIGSGEQKCNHDTLNNHEASGLGGIF